MARTERLEGERKGETEEGFVLLSQIWLVIAVRRWLGKISEMHHCVSPLDHASVYLCNYLCQGGCVSSISFLSVCLFVS